MGRNKKNRLPPFVAILKDMLKSEAWGAIGNPARVAYLHLKGKCITAGGCEITLSFKEMERIMNRHTFARALKQLEAFGFITREKRGGMFRKRNYFRFSEQWRTFKKD
jgi:hypothetical protein